MVSRSSTTRGATAEGAGPGPGHRPQGAGPGRRGRAPDRLGRKKHTTVSVERATLRLAGLQGADPDGIPWVNRLLDALRGDVGLEHGIALPVWDGWCAARRTTSPRSPRRRRPAPCGSGCPRAVSSTRARAAARKQVGAGVRRVDARRRERERLVKRQGDPENRPGIYLIVATGDIYEDMPQAQQAAREGADSSR